jgi:hypothetical protein
LSHDYKRKYTKSELTSLSQGDKNQGKIEVDNFRSNINCSVTSKENFMVPADELNNLKGSSDKNEGGCIRCKRILLNIS